MVIWFGLAIYFIGKEPPWNHQILSLSDLLHHITLLAIRCSRFPPSYPQSKKNTTEITNGLAIFLVACTQLYKPLCQSVGPLVRLLVADCENEPNWHDKTIWAMETISDDAASAPCRVYTIVTVPAQQHATKPSVHTALLYKHHVYKHIRLRFSGFLSTLLSTLPAWNQIFKNIS